MFGIDWDMDGDIDLLDDALTLGLLLDEEKETQDEPDEDDDWDYDDDEDEDDEF